MIEEKRCKHNQTRCWRYKKKMNVTNAKRNHFELNVFSYKDVENLYLPTQQVLLSNLWRTEENVMIYSKTGVGKSWLSLSIAACITGQGKIRIPLHFN